MIATLIFPNVPPPPVKLFDPAFIAPLTVNDPDTDTLSSMVVVPPAAVSYTHLRAHET